MTDFAVFCTTMIAIWAVLGISLHLQFGLTGLVNFGQVLPFAVGAYGAAFAAVHALPIWAGVLIGVVAAPLLGLVVILPAGRLAQDYWALVTLGAGELFRLAMLNIPGIAGGVEGAWRTGRWRCCWHCCCWRQPSCSRDASATARLAGCCACCARTRRWRQHSAATRCVSSAW
jgi:ABC-type branched-subunit amino acid transport system permease subunit